MRFVVSFNFIDGYVDKFWEFIGQLWWLVLIIVLIGVVSAAIQRNPVAFVGMGLLAGLLVLAFPLLMNFFDLILLAIGGESLTFSQLFWFTLGVLLIIEIIAFAIMRTFIVAIVFMAIAKKLPH